jgi:hypothetical protein
MPRASGGEAAADCQAVMQTGDDRIVASGKFSLLRQRDRHVTFGIPISGEMHFRVTSADRVSTAIVCIVHGSLTL